MSVPAPDQAVRRKRFLIFGRLSVTGLWKVTEGFGFLGCTENTQGKSHTGKLPCDTYSRRQKRTRVRKVPEQKTAGGRLRERPHVIKTTELQCDRPDETPLACARRFASSTRIIIIIHIYIYISEGDMNSTKFNFICIIYLNAI